MPHLLSVDLEDWYLDVASVAVTPSAAANALARQLAALERILDDTGVRATFFVLGTTAERYPQHIARLHAAGHEIASHGYRHIKLHDIDRHSFERDIARSAQVLANITGVRPIGYRAPYFSLERADAADAYRALADHGYRYSSSMRGKAAPVRSQVQEIPSSAFSIAGWTMPFGGGGYWRLLPDAAVVGIIGAHDKRGARVATYLHPHELDSEDLDPQRGRLRHAYVNLGRRGIARLLDRLLRSFVFLPYASAIQDCQ